MAVHAENSRQVTDLVAVCDHCRRSERWTDIDMDSWPDGTTWRYVTDWREDAEDPLATICGPECGYAFYRAYVDALYQPDTELAPL